MRVLFLTARFPFPLHRGDQLRAFEQLRILGTRHHVTLVCFDSGGVDPRAREAIGAFCERVVTVPFRRREALAGLARAAASGRPAQVGLYDQAPMRRAVRDLLAAGSFDVVHVQLLRMAPHVEEATVPRVVDLVDSLSLGMRRRRYHAALSGLAAAEARRLLAYERHLCHAFEGACVSSAVDREAIGGARPPAVVPNGVNLTRFAFAPGGGAPNVMVFSGNLGYVANVDAVTWFVGEVLPLVRRAIPGASLRIVGARPARALRRLARRHPGVELVGPVEDMAAALRGAVVAVAPLRMASGQQLKVLEAMAVGIPVVATPMVAEALGFDDAVLATASTPDGLAREVIRLLRDPLRAEAQARRGRRLVEAQHPWEPSVARLEAQYRAAGLGRVERTGS